MTAIVSSVVETVDWLPVLGPDGISRQLALEELGFNGPVLPLGSSMNQKTGLQYVSSVKLAGTDYTSTSIWPQGVAATPQHTLVSFYHKYVPLQSAVKFTAYRNDTRQSTTIAPLVWENGKFRRINAHGAIEIIGDHLYMEDSYTMSIRVFDLRLIFNRDETSDYFPAFAYLLDETDPLVATTPRIFEYFIPQVGQIFINSPSGGNLAFLSHTSTKFIAGNFWIPGSAYASGGKSMIWTWELDHDTYDFPVPVGTAFQYEPQYPYGSEIGQSISKIQGAHLTDDGYLILNRSYGAGTYQLIVMDIAQPDHVYFAGDTTNGLGHNWKNWLYGCEDISITPDGLHMVTVTEFQGDRDVTMWRLSDVLGLLPVVLDPTVEEHQSTLNGLINQRNALNNEIGVLAMQIDTAIAAGVLRFDRDTYAL